MSDRRLYPLVTRDPASGGEMIVTRLECPESGTVLEGRFSLGWVARLSPEQLDFVGALVRQRGNVQKVAAELGITYNSARSRLDEMARTLGGDEAAPPGGDGKAVLDELSSGEIDFEEAMRRLKR